MAVDRCGPGHVTNEFIKTTLIRQIYGIHDNDRDQLTSFLKHRGNLLSEPRPHKNIYLSVKLTAASVPVAMETETSESGCAVKGQRSWRRRRREETFSLVVFILFHVSQSDLFI